MAAVPVMKNQGNRGRIAPAEKATKEEPAARTGEPRASGSMPSSSRAWARSAVSGSTMTPWASWRASSGSTPRDW